MSMYDEDPGLYQRDPNAEARKILTAPDPAEPAPPLHPSIRRRMLLSKIGMTLLITTAIGVAGFFSLAPFIGPKLAEISAASKMTPTPKPSGSVVVVVPSATPGATESAAATQTPGASTPVRTAPPRTAAPPPTSSCDKKGYTIRGRITIAGGGGAAGAQIDLYRAESNTYMASYNADGNGNYAVPVVGTTNYKLYFSMPGVAKAEWWNDKQGPGSANVLQVCRSDINGVNAVLVR